MGKCERWTVAYRRRSGDLTLLEDSTTQFIPVPNTWRFWRADPFLFEKDGRTFLFAELYDRMRLRGVLGYCELTDTGAGAWKTILEEPFHLSYPFVFQDKDDIYMIPEACRSGKILLYRAVSFPDRWECVGSLADMVSVDSTVVRGDSRSYLITYRQAENTMELVLIGLGDDLKPETVKIISEKDDPNVRPAGRLFVHNGHRIRPAQDCTEGYGAALNFMEVTVLDENSYAEHCVKKLRPEDVNIAGTDLPQGIHTYNLTARFEVIDYKEYEFGLVSKVAGVVRRIRRLCHL